MKRKSKGISKKQRDELLRNMELMSIGLMGLVITKSMLEYAHTPFEITKVAADTETKKFLERNL